MTKEEIRNRVVEMASGSKGIIVKYWKYKFKCVKSKEILIMHTFLCAGKKETWIWEK